MAKEPSYEKVANVCNELLKLGMEKPRIKEVYARTKGSRNIAHAHWKRWLGEQDLLGTVNKVDIPKPLADTMSFSLTQAKEEGFSTAEERIDELTQEVESYETGVAELGDQIESLNQSRQQEKDSAEQKILGLERDVSAASAVNQQKQETIEKLEFELNATRKSLGQCELNLEKTILFCSRLEKELAEIKTRELGQNEKLSSLQKKNISLERLVSIKDTEILNLTSQLKTADYKIEQLSADNAELSSRVSTSFLEKRFTELEEKLQQRVEGQRDC
ncbi:replication region DNA-binding N-term [Desulfuromusa kysingii]|uniref:Replication region DNA-binding N-term n=1 Tax=Desulfuromusa kysingii TaxID=37625 RepID=A0A1H3YX73_9BACT|nr:DNA-binding protein [Desulfuromusa kysingii]SEA16056.1 replication region DNA-binding N-term [Desulfuromusa kysingii]